jgi:hypothetical protein
LCWLLESAKDEHDCNEQRNKNNARRKSHHARNRFPHQPSTLGETSPQSDQCPLP